MDETTTADEETREREQLDEIDRCFNLLERLQGLFLKTSSLRTGDLTQASGRRCILGISGLKYHKYNKFFEVRPDGVTAIDPYQNYNTYILAPIDSVLRVLKGVLDGDTSAFSAEWARGKAKLVGERRIHDGWVFGEVFRQLAEMIKKYREL